MLCFQVSVLGCLFEFVSNLFAPFWCNRRFYTFPNEPTYSIKLNAKLKLFIPRQINLIKLAATKSELSGPTMVYENNFVSRAPGQPAGIFCLNKMLKKKKKGNLCYIVLSSIVKKIL